MSAISNHSLVPQVYRVERVRRELDDAATLTVVPERGMRPACRPGQFNMLYAFGVGEAAISVSDVAPGAFVHTVREVGAVSRALTALEGGAALGLRGPFGHAWPVEAAQGHDVVVVAGGLGLAPLRPAVRYVLDRRARYGRVAILLGSRSPQAMLYRHQLEHWRRRLDIDLEVTVDSADADWRGNIGVVPALIPRATFDPDNTVAWVCGPEVMMRFTLKALLEAGVAADRIHLSLERNMKCAIGLCGHCQYGPDFICKEGPVMRYDRIAGRFAVREI